MSLKTPYKIRNLQRKLYLKEKTEAQDAIAKYLSVFIGESFR